jgi:hypothetical protein
VEAHQNVSLLIGIDRIIALVKVAIASTRGRPITKRALRACGRSGGALGDGGGIVHIRGAVVTNIAHLLTAKAVPDFMRVARTCVSVTLITTQNLAIKVIAIGDATRPPIIDLRRLKL